jgi:outer membrane lipoprotein LolB
MRRALLFLTAVLAGCATVQPTPAPEVDWDARLAAAGSLEGWRMTGRVAVVVGEDGGSAGIDWRQAGATSDVAFTGPLGVGSLRAVLAEDGLMLEDGAGERLQGAPAEALLQARLGLAVPFDHLRYWLLGSPAPGEPYQPVPASSGGLAAFEQAGWTVGIGRLEPSAGLLLPTRVTVSGEDARLKLVVTGWTLSP